jgi:FkbM family methyltransferase
MNGTTLSGYRRSAARVRLTAATITSLARWTPYLESEMCGLRHLVRPGGVCIDVGSAAGLYTMALSRLAGPAGQVHSVEPLPFAHLMWAQVLNTRRTGNVRHHAVALGAEPGTDLMRVPVGRYGLVTGRSFLARQAGGPDPNAEFADQIAVTVKVDTLDRLCEREVITRLDFIKIDVEGAELEVLEGGKQAIETHSPVMLIEIEARHAARYRRSPDDITGWLSERGYTMHTWRRGWHPASRIHPGTRNYLFRPPDPDPGAARLTSDQRKPLAA